MPLTPEQSKKTQDFLNRKRRNHQCPSCGQSNWSPGDVIMAPVMQNGGVAMGGPSVPMVQVICDNCAYVQLYAAVPIGLI